MSKGTPPVSQLQRKRLFNARVTSRAAYAAAERYLFLHDWVGGLGASITVAYGAIGSLATISSLQPQFFAAALKNTSGYLGRRCVVIPILGCGFLWLLDDHSKWYDRHKRLLKTGNAFNVLADAATGAEAAYFKLRIATMRHSTGHIPASFHKRAKYNVLVDIFSQKRGSSQKMLSTNEFYISMDTERLGDNPYEHPLINLGCVAFLPDGTEIGRFTINLAWPEGYQADPDTVEWFQTKNANAWAQITKDTQPPAEAMKQLRAWYFAMCTKGGRPVWVFYPSIVDGTWLHCYWFKYLGHPTGGKGPGFHAIDIRSYAMGKLGCTYEETGKDKPRMAPYLPSNEHAPHTHTGLDDAYEQGLLFLNLKNKL